MVEMWQSYSQKLRRSLLENFHKAEKVRNNKKAETGGKYLPKNTFLGIFTDKQVLKGLHYLKAETRRGFHLCGM